MHVFWKPRVRHHNFAIIQNIVADQTIQEITKLSCELSFLICRNRFQIFQRLGKAMSNLDVFATKLPEQFCIMIAGYTHRRTMSHHIANDAQAIKCFGAAINKIPHEHGSTFFGMLKTKRRPARLLFDWVRLIAKSLQQLLEFIVASMNVANKIKRPMLVRPVIPKRNTLNRGGGDFFNTVHHKHVPESFTFETAK